MECVGCVFVCVRVCVCVCLCVCVCVDEMMWVSHEVRLSRTQTKVFLVFSVERRCALVEKTRSVYCRRLNY